MHVGGVRLNRVFEHGLQQLDDGRVLCPGSRRERPEIDIGVAEVAFRRALEANATFVKARLNQALPTVNRRRASSRLIRSALEYRVVPPSVLPVTSHHRLTHGL